MAISRTEAELDALSELPMTADQLATARRVPRVRSLRRALGMTQEEFSQTYRIPLPMLRDWETGASEPDVTASAYIAVIAHEPTMAAKALERRDAA